ncbi:MAG: twin-arginine translocase TatA/TatE family subunit [Deltaproteobacteria bacterium]|nr:twin-arginine translocase TatA/TatE family subunit [Deltaproteobacteria bacterium]
MLAPWKILLILAVVLLIFGAKKLPDLGKHLGEAISNFRKSVKDSDTTSPEALADKTKTEKEGK